MSEGWSRWTYLLTTHSGFFLPYTIALLSAVIVLALPLLLLAACYQAILQGFGIQPTNRASDDHVHDHDHDHDHDQAKDYVNVGVCRVVQYSAYTCVQIRI